MAIMSAFQAEDEGSIPFTCSKSVLNLFLSQRWYTASQYTTYIAGQRRWSSRRPHKSKIAGSSPAPAPNTKDAYSKSFYLNCRTCLLSNEIMRLVFFGSIVQRQNGRLWLSQAQFNSAGSLHMPGQLTCGPSTGLKNRSVAVRLRPQAPGSKCEKVHCAPLEGNQTNHMKTRQQYGA